jgi:predicted Zn-dependent protease
MAIDMRRLLEAASAATLGSGATWTGVRRMRTETRYYGAKDGRFETAAMGGTDGVMVETLFKGQFGYSCTPDMTPSGVDRAAKMALASAMGAAARKLYSFDASSVRPAVTVDWATPRQKLSGRGGDAYSGHAVKLTEKLKVSDKIIQAQAEIIIRRDLIEILSSSGADIRQERQAMTSGFTAIARDGNVIQRRSVHGGRGMMRQGGYEYFDFENDFKEAIRVGEQAVELLSAEECPTITGTLVLHPDQMMLQIHESVGHPTELDRILGDERNYAGSTFVKVEDIGTLRYGSDLMNITFDPTIATELASYAADDIGAKAEKQFIVKDGILVRALGSLESQARSGKPGVANQRATSWNRAPIDRMANLNLEPGKDSLDSIIASVEKGVFMEANRSWSIDDYRNKFQFGCEYAKLIENGKITKTLRNPNYRGVSATFWRNLFKVGDASTFEVYGTPNCGKGEPNQVITVGHGSPVCAFREVEIFGGAS